MENQMAVFNFKNQAVRTVMIGNDPWWVAKDVCDILGIDKYRDALARLDDDERGSVLVDTHGGEQEMGAINESGLYSLILRSRKPEAKAFKKWVTSEVLPSIRKTGAYVNPVRNPITEIDRMAGMMTQMLPALTSKLSDVTSRQFELEDRVNAVEEKQKRVDPRAIEERMFVLHQLKVLITKGTKDQPRPVNYGTYWRALKEHCRVGSFANRAALDVPTMDKAIEFARNWCFERGVTPPTLFDRQEPAEEIQNVG